MRKQFLIISITLGIIAIPIGFLAWLNDRAENTHGQIMEAERCLDALAARVREEIPDVKGLSPEEANTVRQVKKKLGTPLFLNPTLIASLDRCVQGLTAHNANIGKSKFIVRTGVYLMEYGSYGPYSIRSIQASSSEPWAEKEWIASLAEATGIGLVSGFSTFILGLVMLLLLRWSWTFLLARLRELSNALRGR